MSIQQAMMGAVASSGGPGYVIPTSGLVAEYLFDGNADDTSGNNYDGTASGVNWVTPSGASVQVAEFNGTSSTIGLPTSVLNTGMQGVKAISMSFRIKRASISTGTETEIFYSNHGSASVQFDILSDNTLRVAGRSSTSDGYQQQSSTTTLNSTSSYYYVVGILDFENDRLICYIDNSEEFDSAASFGSSTFSINTVSYINIGEFNGNRFFDGEMLLARLYGRKLTTTEIDNLYQEGQDKLGI